MEDKCNFGKTTKGKDTMCFKKFAVNPRYFVVRLSRIHDFAGFLSYIYGHYFANVLEKSRKIEISEHPKFSLKFINILIINSIS